MDAINAYLNEVTARCKPPATRSMTRCNRARMMADAALLDTACCLWAAMPGCWRWSVLPHRRHGADQPHPRAGAELGCRPATMTSQMERLPGYGRVIVDHQPIQAGDVVIIHSVSGPVPVDVAARAQLAARSSH